MLKNGSIQEGLFESGPRRVITEAMDESPSEDPSVTVTIPLDSAKIASADGEPQLSLLVELSKDRLSWEGGDLNDLILTDSADFKDEATVYLSDILADGEAIIEINFAKKQI